MENKYISNKLIQSLILVFVAVFSRVLPHPVNFTPIAAIALVGGVYLTRKQAFAIPILAMIASDVVIGFDNFPTRISVYGSFLLTALVGIWLKNHKNTKNVILGSIFSSILFFLITNFTVWAFGTMYPKSFVGLLDAYFYAIPFFRNTLLGDLFYGGIFFGLFELAVKYKNNAKLALR